VFAALQKAHLIAKMSGPKSRESLLSTVPLDEKEIGMSKVEGTFALGPHSVKRLGYGAMQLAANGIAYVSYFPLGGLTPLQSSALSEFAQRPGATPMQVAIAWLLQRSPNLLLIPRTSSIDHLRENLAAAELTLPGIGMKNACLSG
jgi:Aldo/keto reductase family